MFSTGASTAPRRRAPSRWWRRGVWTPNRIVTTYALVSVAWIAFSDRALLHLVTNPSLRGHLQTLKGTAFVAITSLLLLELIRRGEPGMRSISAEVRATVDSMADGVLVVDGRLRIVEANRAALQLLRVDSKDDVLGPLEEWGRRYALRYGDGSPIPFERYATIRALGGERVPAFEAILRRADGRDVFVSVSAAPVVGSGQRGLAVAVLRDVSATRRLDEMRDEFLATAAHEFKTPLAVIKAYAQLLQKREPAEAQPLLVIQRQVDRLSRLVQDLLDTSRLRLDPGEERREHFDLSALAVEVVGRARSGAPDHALTVAVDGPAPVHADRERIARVLTSLVDNGVRFSPGGGAVAARVSRSDGEVTVSVEDHGLGIAPDRQARIFERYYRAHAGTPEDYGGLGLGLDVSREIVARHGGRMWFESEAGRGSTFHFSLPLSTEARA
jgi:two-component system, OmpR family, phosphate regulon sensor histidine kinase PhoR